MSASVPTSMAMSKGAVARSSTPLGLWQRLLVAMEADADLSHLAPLLRAELDETAPVSWLTVAGALGANPSDAQMIGVGPGYIDPTHTDPPGPLVGGAWALTVRLHQTRHSAPRGETLSTTRAS